MKNLRILSTLFLLFSVLSPQAHAVTVTAFGGTYFGDGENPLLGGEVTFGVIPTLEIGAFYERSSCDPNSSTLSGDTRHFYGAVGRVQLPLLSFFADARVGGHHTVDGLGYALDGLHAQLGAGYSFGIVPGIISLKPRLGLLLLETQGRWPAANASLLASITF